MGKGTLMAALPWHLRPDLVAPPDGFRIVVDTREQTPLFSPSPGPGMPGDGYAVRDTLTTGDYSLLGHEARITIERKSLQDLYGSCSSGRERFQREFERLAEFPTAILLIEATYRAVIEPDPGEIRSLMNPWSVEGTVIHWCQEYGVIPLFAGSHAMARRLCSRWLAIWWMDHGDEL